jgi:hypothetical protein
MMAQYTVEDVKGQIKPLSENAFVRFFQTIWRWWLGVWYGFVDKHPKASSIIYKIFFFIVFSEGVTIFQILVLMFLPYVFGLKLAGTEFMFPKVEIKVSDSFSYYWSFLGNDINYNTAGEVIIGGGLGYFLAFKIATFLAQCINFPLQRNITYRSHGNPWWQAMWYFIGWVLINLFCDAINNLWLPISNHYLPYAVSSILAMIAQGGIAMVIFFFIFMVIFPDNNKMAQKSKAKYEKLVAENAPAEKIEAAKAKSELWASKAALSNAEKEYVQAKTLSNTKAIRYFAIVKASEKAKTEEEKATYPEKIEKCFNEAVSAIDTLKEKETAFEAVKNSEKKEVA